MATNFPIAPSVDQTYSSGATTWKWTGVSWIVVAVPLDLDDLADVSVAAPTDQQILQYDAQSSNWAAATINFSAAFNGGTITNPLFVNNAGESTSVNSGAFRVAGGAAFAGNVFIGGIAVVEDQELQLRARSQIKLFNADNTRYIGLQSPTSISVDRTYVLPGTDGSAGQFLRTNGSGTLTWASAAGAGGGTPAGGLSGQIQFNDSDLFAGDAGLTFNANTQLLAAANITANGTVNMTATTESTSTSSGVLQVSGGVAITKQLNVSGAVNRFVGNTNATSTTTGTIIVTGGIGISNALHVGSTVSAAAQPTNAEHLTNKQYVDSNILVFSVAFGA